MRGVGEPMSNLFVSERLKVDLEVGGSLNDQAPLIHSPERIVQVGKDVGIATRMGFLLAA